MKDCTVVGQQPFARPTNQHGRERFATEKHDYWAVGHETRCDSAGESQLKITTSDKDRGRARVARQKNIAIGSDGDQNQEWLLTKANRNSRDRADKIMAVERRKLAANYCCAVLKKKIERPTRPLIEQRASFRRKYCHLWLLGPKPRMTGWQTPTASYFAAHDHG
jgi:hypothetical protein